MLLRRYSPHPLLSPHVETVWVFESPNPLPVRDLRTIVPNARLKLIIHFRGGQLTGVNERTLWHDEGTISVTGMMSGPVIVQSSSSPIGILGVEFKTASAYRFFGLPLKELTDAIYDIGEVLGKSGRDLKRRIAEANVPEKIRLLEEFLLGRLSDSPQDDPVALSAVQAITATAGRIRIADLGRQLGYSKRYLDLKFADYVGLSPKALARIVRFQQFYKQWGKGTAPERIWKGIDDGYYDQAHFIKEFKQFTGHTPSSFSHQHNEFGRIFYRE